MSERLTRPALLTVDHDLSVFESGEVVLDDWLRKRALDNLDSGASRTYVVVSAGTNRVVGFYALSMGQILSQDVTAAMRRNMPRNIPAVILGRLAVDRIWQGKGIARALLADAVDRCLRASTEVASRLLVVHAISTDAEFFYRYHGFTRLPVETPTLALDLVKYARLAKRD